MALPNEKECKYAVAAFNKILGPIFEYDHRKGFSKPWFKKFKASSQDVPEESEEFEGQVFGVLSGLSVLGPFDRGAAFLRSVGDLLPEDERRLVKIWRDNPWRMMAFSIKKKLSGDLLLVEPLGDPPQSWDSQDDWGDLVLYSPNLYNRTIPPGEIILTLLWMGFGAWNTYGPIISLPGWTEDDLKFILWVDGAPPVQKKLPALGKVLDLDTSLTDRLCRSPVAAELTFFGSHYPAIQGPLGTAIECASLFQGDLGGTLSSPEDWKIRLKPLTGPWDVEVATPEFLRIALGDGGPMRSPRLTFLVKTGDLALQASSLKAYSQGQKMLSGIFDFPPQPHRKVTLGAYLTAKEIFPKPWDLLDQVEDSSPEEEPPMAPNDELEKTKDMFSAIMDRLVTNYNEGRRESPQEVAAALGAPLDQVLSLQNAIQDKIPADSEGHDKSLLNLSPRAFREFFLDGVLSIEDYWEFTDETLEENPRFLELIEQTPVIRVFRWLVDQSLFNGGHVPTTTSGYLSTALVKEAVREFGALDAGAQDLSRVKKQSDWGWFSGVMRLLSLAGLFSQDRKGFTLRKEAASDLERGELLWKKLFKRAFFNWNWPQDILGVNYFPQLDKMTKAYFYALGLFTTNSQKKDGWVDIQKWASVYWELLPRDFSPMEFESTEHKLFLEMMLESSVLPMVNGGPLGILGLGEIHPQDRKKMKDRVRVRVTELANLLYQFRSPDFS